MGTAMKILGISGSLRKGSFNTALLHAAVGMAPAGIELIARTIHGVPLYDADLEAVDGIPEKVRELKDLAVEADGIMLFTPEYNNSLPGVFKNAIDWMSRPSTDIAQVFGGKPIAVLGASPGNFGTILSQNAWLTVLRTLGADAWFGGRLMVSRAGGVFNEEGQLVDDKVKHNLAVFIEGFCAFVGDRKTG